MKGRKLSSLDLEAAENRIRDLNRVQEISSLLKNHTLLWFEHVVILAHK
jgi:hypothetical protein